MLARRLAIIHCRVSAVRPLVTHTGQAAAQITGISRIAELFPTVIPMTPNDTRIGDGKSLRTRPILYSRLGGLANGLQWSVDHCCAGRVDRWDGVGHTNHRSVGNDAGGRRVISADGAVRRGAKLSLYRSFHLPTLSIELPVHIPVGRVHIFFPIRLHTPPRTHPHIPAQSPPSRPARHCRRTTRRRRRNSPLAPDDLAPLQGPS